MTTRELDSIQVSSTDVAIRILRPYIVQILYKYGVMGEFLFVSNGGCIEFEKELTTPLKTAITSVNGTNSLIIRSIKAMQSVRSVQTVQTMPAVQPVQTMQAVQAVQPVQSIQSVQSAQPVQSVQSLYPPMYSEYSQFPFPYGKAGFTPHGASERSSLHLRDVRIDTFWAQRGVRHGERPHVGVLRERERAAEAAARGEGEWASG